jgi:uncharacterized membrane protein
MNWFVYTMLGGLFIGGSLFFRKLATKASGSLGGFIIEGLVYGGLVVLFLLLQKNKGTFFTNPWYASVSAVSLFFGAMFLYKALSSGKLAVVNVLYLAISVATVFLLSMFVLKEHITIKQVLGFLFAIAAIFLLK